jgi:threonine dehydrogenase-like Zn-dependent dehydrogenase
MKAVVIESPGKLIVKEVEKPTIKDNEILIKVDSASICNATDGHIFNGHFDGYHDFYPQIAGHEVAGTVVEIGKDVTDIKLGDLFVQYTPRGAFCEYSVINPKGSLCARVPESIPLKARSLLEMFHGAYVSTVYPAMIKEDESVLVVGQGPMGITAAIGAKLTAKQVIAVDFYQNRLDMSKSFGVDYALNRTEMTASEISQKIIELTDGKGVDVVIMAISDDRSENSDAYDMAIDAMRQGGRMTGLFVDSKNIGKNQRINPRQLLRKEAVFCHTLNNVYKTWDDQLAVFQKVVDEIAAKKIQLENMVTHEIGFSEIEKAIELCGKELEKVIKVVVYPNK